MAEIKRVSDQYKITAPSIVLDGNVQITGSSTSVDVITSVISDTSITLNAGETGAGVSTLGTTAQIIVDRGSLPDVNLRWNEATDTWQITVDGSTYGDILVGSGGVVAAAGSDTYVQYNGSGYLGAEAAFAYNYTTNYLTVSNVKIGNDSITNSVSNANLTISANGTGTLNVSSVAGLDYIGSTPGSTASKTKFYAATPGAASSGLYFVNTVDSDELVSKKKAIMFGLVMR
jgi:hypothetical protein